MVINEYHILLLIIVVPFILGAIIVFTKQFIFYKKSIILNGKVISNDEKDDDEGLRQFFPVIQYFDEDEQKYYILYSKSDRNKPLAVGNIISIRVYKINNKRKCEINSIYHIFKDVFLLLFMAVGFFLSIFFSN